MKYTESGPSDLRSSSIFADISFNATSQLIFWYLPLTSFIGYLRRISPWPCSRIAAPLAQCAPRLMGESNTGSWPIHTPFCTSASMAQPTEQWVHTVRLTSTLPCGLTSAASALPIMAKGNWLAMAETAALVPTVTPERLRKVRRSMVSGCMPEMLRLNRPARAVCAVLDFLVSAIWYPPPFIPALYGSSSARAR